MPALLSTAEVAPGRLCAISETETWGVDSEWMQSVGCERRGTDSPLFVARILWEKPNQLAVTRPE